MKKTCFCLCFLWLSLLGSAQQRPLFVPGLDNLMHSNPAASFHNRSVLPAFVSYASYRQPLYSDGFSVPSFASVNALYQLEQGSEAGQEWIFGIAFTLDDTDPIKMNSFSVRGAYGKRLNDEGLFLNGGFAYSLSQISVDVATLLPIFPNDQLLQSYSGRVWEHGLSWGLFLRDYGQDKLRWSLGFSMPQIQFLNDRRVPHYNLAANLEFIELGNESFKFELATQVDYFRPTPAIFSAVGRFKLSGNAAWRRDAGLDKFSLGVGSASNKTVLFETGFAPLKELFISLFYKKNTNRPRLLFSEKLGLNVLFTFNQ